MKTVVITGGEAGRRLDKYLMKYMGGAPKPLIYKWLRKKSFRVNGVNATGNEVLIGGDILNLYLSEDTIEKFVSEKNVKISHKPLDIVYEDVNLLVLNKPAGILTHPASASDGDTLINRALGYMADNGAYDPNGAGTFKPVTCGRLDRNTSGAVTVAKNLQASQAVSEAVRDGRADRIYLAVVRGTVDTAGRLENYFFKDAKTNTSVVTGAETRQKIVTGYGPVRAAGGFSLVKVQIFTGKPHQIRLQLKHADLPVLGDPKYGDAELNRWLYDKTGVKNQLLHAWKLKYYVPDGFLSYINGVEFTAKPPENFIKTCNFLNLTPKDGF